ncbi:MAG: Ig domain-containing protein [Acidimicrobiales bacterium]
MSVSTISTAWASPATTYVPVTSADLIVPPATPAAGQFSLVNEGDGSGGVTTVSGPGSARGSLQLTVTGTGSHWSVVNLDHNSTLLSGINALSYSTYTNEATGTLDPNLQLVIDPGNTTGLDAGVTFSTLNFEPYLQSPPHSVVPNTWQTWNVLNGVVWGTHLTGAPISAPISWSTFVSDYPNAKITGGVGLGVGSNWEAMVGNVSGLTIGTSAGATSYIFEPVAYLQITTAALPSGTVGTPYSANLAAIGGNPSYKWSVTSGRLPKGLHLNKTTGAISGVPGKHDSGTSNFTVRVVDTKIKVRHQPATQNSATQALSIAIS